MNTSKSFLKKIRIYALSFALISCFMTVFTLPTYAVAPSDATVSDFTQLQTAVETSYASATEDMVITVSASIDMTAILKIPSPATGGKTLTIKSASSSNPFTLTRGATGDLFTVSHGATLILENIIIDGAKNGSFANDGGGSLVKIVGSCILQNGAVLQNNVFAGTFSYGGGVHKDEGGTFILSGGKITGNSAGTKGGGVYTGPGSFTMNGGEITGNVCVNGEGGGVHTYSCEFTMNGGEITGNSCITGVGGGLYSISPSVFDPLTMNGGKIAGNSASAGGGIYMTETPFVLNDGEISGNSAETDGGGVYMRISSFTVSNGKITGNSANNGGGVYIYSAEFYDMSGGEITGNSASTNGGGVCVAGNSYQIEFYVSGTAKISDNTQGTGGSANNVYLSNGRNIKLGTGESGMNIGVQTAAENGVFVASNATAADVGFFTSDSKGKVVHEGGQLKIVF